MRWLTLDLDGTLADWPFRYVIQPYMQRLVAQYPSLRLELNAEYRRRLGLGDPQKIFDWGDIHRAVKEKLGLEVEFPDIPHLLEQATLPPEMVYPDVLPSLEAFKAQGWKLALATNGLSKYQQPLTDKLGLPYDFVLAPDTVGATKPQADFWKPLPEATRVVHVGDLLTHDIWGANAAGHTAVWVWRNMPPAWRNTPIQERRNRGDYGEVIRAVTEQELDEHGFIGRQQPSVLPQPDHTVADFAELAEALRAESFGS